MHMYLYICVCVGRYEAVYMQICMYIYIYKRNIHQLSLGHYGDNRKGMFIKIMPLYIYLRSEDGAV